MQEGYQSQHTSYIFPGVYHLPTGSVPFPPPRSVGCMGRYHPTYLVMGVPITALSAYFSGYCIPCSHGLLVRLVAGHLFRPQSCVAITHDYRIYLITKVLFSRVVVFHGTNTIHFLVYSFEMTAPSIS